MAESIENKRSHVSGGGDYLDIERLLDFVKRSLK